MAFTKFIPTVWAEGLMRDLEKEHVFVKDCTTKFEGQLKQKGDKVIVPMLGDVTIKEMDPKNRNDDIDGPETLADYGVEVTADTARYFNFLVSDIDAVQSQYNIMEEARRKAVYGLADEHDKKVAGLAASVTNKVLATPVKVVADTAVEGEINVLELIDLMASNLYEHNVKTSETITLTVPPRFSAIFKRAYLKLDTDNTEKMGNGFIGRYGGVILRMSNNVYNSGTTSAPNHHIMCRTTDAVAFVQQLSKIKAYEPEKKFCDAVKGMSLFGTKIIRPKSICVAEITY